jgi:hypothetical protein
LGEVVAGWIRRAAQSRGIEQEVKDIARTVKDAIGQLANAPTTDGILYRWLVDPPTNHPARAKGPVAYLREIAGSDYWKAKERRPALRRATRAVASHWSNLLHSRLSEILKDWPQDASAFALRNKLISPGTSPSKNWEDYTITELHQVLVDELSKGNKLKLKPAGSDSTSDITHAVIGAWATAFARLLRDNVDQFIDPKGRDKVRVLYELITGRKNSDDEIGALQSILVRYNHLARSLIQDGYLAEKELRGFELELYRSFLVPSEEEMQTFLRATANLVRRVVRRIRSRKEAASRREGMYENFDDYHEQHVSALADDIVSTLMPKDNEGLEEGAEVYRELTGRDYT